MHLSGSNHDASTPSDPISETLDNEIASLKAQIAKSTAQRSLLASTLLSSHSTLKTLTSLRTSKTHKPKPHATSTSTPPADISPLLTTSSHQTTHTTTNLYRACASITTFTLTDPDPHAVNSGHILGLRFDISRDEGKGFGKSLYVMLNRPFEGEHKNRLRVHRHTLPPCIPLSYLAKKFLPAGIENGNENGKGSRGRKQDLQKFARALRREIVSYQNRITTIKTLRREFSLDEKKSVKGKEREAVIEDISAADAEAKQIKIIWCDGKVGRVLVGEKGEVVRCVVIGEGGREREVERRVEGLEGDRGVEGVGRRILEGVY